MCLCFQCDDDESVFVVGHSVWFACYDKSEKNNGGQIKQTVIGYTIYYISIVDMTLLYHYHNDTV